MIIRELNRNIDKGAVMIEEALIGTNFLVPVRKPQKKSGYIDRKTYADAIKEAWLIGFYDERGQFRVDRSLMFQYHAVIPEIADSLAADTRDEAYQKYKLAALQKGSLDVFLEWRVSTALHSRNLDFSAARLLRDQVGFPTVLVDMGGPSYDVVALDGVDAMLDSFEHGYINYHAVG